MERVLVGVDGSEGSQDALRWAVGYAERTGARLCLLTVFRFEQSVGVPGARWPVDTYEDIQLQARSRQDEARKAAVPADLEVDTEIAFGNAAEVLLDHAATADLLVVGQRGLGGFKGLLLGSVSQQCIHHAPCPITVVPSVAS